MRHRRTVIFIFAGYCALMAWLLFGRERFEAPMGYWNQVLENINPLPFETIIRFVKVLLYEDSAGLRSHAVINLVGNVVMFLPFGFFPALLWERFRSLWRCVLWGGGIIVCVELIQLFTLVGNCDFDDLLLNVVGIALGYGVFVLVSRKGRSGK